MKEQAEPTGKGDQRPYRVDRWRHTYTHVDDIKADTDSSPQNQTLHSAAIVLRGRLQQKEYMVSSPTQDLLLHLIQLNVLRGFFDNKLTLMRLTAYLSRQDGAEEFQVVPPETVFPGRAALISTSDGEIPEPLRPTALQNSVLHATCIDLVPFPRMRDNLIEQEGRYDWEELIDDLLGQLVDPTCFCAPLQMAKERVSAEASPSFYYGDEDDYTANRNGLIIWGAAHVPESWEVTPGFLRKWGWCLKGCNGIIESSNQWRIRRGEEPFAIVT